MAGSSTGKKGAKKSGRGLRSPSHQKYVSEGHREINKIRRIKKHLKKRKNDTVALKALRKLA